MKKLKKITAVIIAICVVFTSGYLSSSYRQATEDSEGGATYSLLAKRLFIDNPNDIRLDFRQLNKSLLADLEAGLGENDEKVSVYFEYLPSGVSFSINPELEAVAASLMKTEIAMHVYKVAERGGLSLGDLITITADMLDPTYGSFHETALGNTYTLKDLVTIMLHESDNTALKAIKSALSGKINPFELSDYVGIKSTGDENGRLLLSSKSYSSIFKCLYLACYNTQRDSQEILNILTQTNFTDRLPGLLPESTVVAHKIGTFYEEYQSDCGIVYVGSGDSDYLVCIMVSHKDPEASKEIARMSYKIFSYVTAASQAAQ